MVGIESNTTVIGHLRIKSSSPDPEMEQQRIARMLRSATLHPGGLPETAMLVVRRLADPLPSRLRAGPRDLLPDASWERAVAGALEKLAASAARPAYGAVPAETNAVLFYDRAEVLASLALDWMSGTLPVQWWWRELLRSRDAVTALLREWIEAPQYIPGALGLLSQRNEAVKFVQRLPRQAAAEMLEAVVRAYNVPQPEIEARVPLPQDGGRRLALFPRMSKAKAQKQMIAASAYASRWAAEAFTPGLSTVHTMLLVQGLMLRRAPAVVRTTAFQKELRLWRQLSYDLAEMEIFEAETGRQDALQATPRQDSPAHAMTGETLVLEEAAKAFQPAPSMGDVRAQASLEAAETERPVAPQGKATKRPVRRTPQSSAQAPALREDDRQGMVEAEPQAVEREIIPIPEPANLPEATSEEAATELTSGPSITFATEHGGVFFLLTLALYLDIYGDFTSPAEPGLELNLWDFLALMSAELTEGEIEKDPLWEQLASLAGRLKSTRPGLDFDPPDEWRLPEEWLAPFPEAYDAQPALIHGRMITRHPAGFIVLDIPAETNDADGAKETMAKAERLQRWVKWLSSYFRARLVRALGREDAVKLVCGRPAEVVFTLTHVDVFFSLDHHPIELRMAGLDRDLGWIPAAGRYVSFHFR